LPNLLGIYHQSLMNQATTVVIHTKRLTSIPDFRNPPMVPHFALDLSMCFCYNGDENPNGRRK